TVREWTVPKEWNIADAWIKNAARERVVDFQKSNLHVVNSSVPVRTTMSLDELRARLHSLPAQPTLVPYRTTYYEETWGFCLADDVLAALSPGDYDVCFGSTCSTGALTS